MTHDLTPPLVDVLRQIQGGAEPSQFSPAQINKLVKAGFLHDVPTGMALTQAGLDAVAQTTWYVIQQQVPKAWINIPGERPFADLAAAERRAAQYSVLNEVLIRVAPEGVEPPTFPVFDFGKRFTLDAQTGARIADPGYRQTEDDYRDSGHFYMVQRRTPHYQTDGQFMPWEPASERQFVDLDLAIHNARQAEGDEPYEYRVAPVDVLDLPPVIYFHGAAMPDLGILDQLVQVGASQLADNESLPVRKQSALGQMLADWTLHNPREILNICAEALAEDSQLSDQVRELRDNLS